MKKAYFLKGAMLLSVSIFMFGIISAMNRANEKPDVTAAMASLSSALVGTMAFVMSYNSNGDLSEENKAQRLFLYCQRYSTDKNIQKVIRWMINNMNNNGSLKISDQRTMKNAPDIYEKEVFMSFYEELAIQIRRKMIDKHDARRLFSYYALQFNKYQFFRDGVTDYYDEDSWKGYHEFVRKMGGKIEQTTIN